MREGVCVCVCVCEIDFNVILRILERLFQVPTFLFYFSPSPSLALSLFLSFFSIPPSLSLSLRKWV